MAPPKPRPQSPKEAIAWFRKRVPIKKKAWLKLNEAAQGRAFTIAGVAKLDLIAKVHEKLVAAQKRGDTLESFKKKVHDELAAEWGEERPWHVEVIFRNANQRAYQAGRREQLMEKNALELRPYLKFEPILDARTTEICSSLKGVVLPADHPFWKTHWPPLHHNCRSAVRSLTTEQAQVAGITKRAPRKKPADGFGSVTEEWKPNLSGYPPLLSEIYKRGR